MSIKLNGFNNYDSIEVFLSEQTTPIAYANKLACLMGAGFSEEDARNDIATTPIELELYYNVNQGLWGVEAEAVECADIFNPYDGKKCISYEEEE